MIVPILNEEGNIDALIRKVTGILENYPDYELLFVDDGSTDETLRIVQENRKQNDKIHYVSFSRNFGHQNALRAGLDYATGDCVISMDGDLQHPPELIPELIERWQEGYDIVYTVRKDDLETPFLKRKCADVFYRIMNQFSDINIDKGAADFRLINRNVVEIIKSLKENDLFLRGMIAWLGFKQCAIAYVPGKRHSGKTKYSYEKMTRLAVTGITSFSVKPLHISGSLGYAILALAACYWAYAITRLLFTSNTLPGWAFVVATVLSVGALQMIMTGILAQYIGKLFIESKKRPNYIIKEKSYE